MLRRSRRRDAGRGRGQAAVHAEGGYLGRLRPGRGFLVGKSDFGQLDISAYGMVRYMNQNDDENVFRDHLAMSVP